MSRGIGEASRRFIPIVSWLPRYKKAWLARDVIAGFTIWGLLIPEMIAYASLAGLPPQAGLYTLLASLALYAVFGTSRHLVVAGTSASAVLVFSAVTALNPDDTARYAALAGGVILLAGILFILAGLLRLGFITQFLSRPVMAGFVFGLAIFVTVSQLPKIFGIEKGHGDTVEQFGHLVTSLGSTSMVTLAVGAGALVLLFGLERFAPRVPGGIVALVLGIVISSVFGLAGHGVATIGAIPTGLPSIGFPDLHAGDLWVLVPSALGMVLVMFSESLGAAQTFAEKYRYRIDPNQEMIALGTANLGSGFLGGLAAGGSLSQSAVNEGAGARSQMSPLVASVLSLVTVIALTPVFKNLPEAVLGALIIHAVSHLMKVGEMRRYYRLVPREFWIGMLTLAGVIVLDVLPGLILGVGTSLLLLVYRASKPRLSVLGADPHDPGAYVDIQRDPAGVTVPGVLVMRPDAALFYANAQSVADGVEAAAHSSGAATRVVILDLDATDEIDITSAESLDKVSAALDREHVQLALAHVHHPTLALAREAGLLTTLSDERVFPNIAAALAWASDAGSNGSKNGGRPE
ncbi:high affinity sulfate transporter 1 [Actinoplanes lutulentus]|uniref:High affinity sulfate transporter 1 n=1 Tax=Actinoplanes lutulentus TaxID=1287878 RepID=A0A327ZLP4_9ACTN|nr:sulfate permease [Actinoplanes lutulentus]MBB2940645.1 high affinity sulfate transporter 1 [Actinoplanes lutulentus]RAK42956.1 high affinity sulfate transporter 1 [Actinoplanes lutulentus]